METYVQATIGMLAVINPFVCGAMLLQLEHGIDNRTASKVAIKAMLIVLIILLAAAIGGRYILNVFGISMAAFKIVGGIVLGFIGFQMLAGSNNSSSSKKVNLNEIIMFAASPGTIAMVISLAAVDHKELIPIAAITGTLIAVVITLAIMIIMVFLSKGKQASGQSIFSKFMGLIIVSMGIQFMLVGIKHFFGV
jgi:multiple antibiotic resistance protein